MSNLDVKFKAESAYVVNVADIVRLAYSALGIYNKHWHTARILSEIERSAIYDHYIRVAIDKYFRERCDESEE